jgi:hypothetical protein
MSEEHTLAMLEWAWAQPEWRSNRSTIGWRELCVGMVVDSMRRRGVSLGVLAPERLPDNTSMVRSESGR